MLFVEQFCLLQKDNNIYWTILPLSTFLGSNLLTMRPQSGILLLFPLLSIYSARQWGKLSILCCNMCSFAGSHVSIVSGVVLMLLHSPPASLGPLVINHLLSILLPASRLSPTMEVVCYLHAPTYWLLPMPDIHIQYSLWTTENCENSKTKYFAKHIFHFKNHYHIHPITWHLDN